jgi:uncharacterized membrane protein
MNYKKLKYRLMGGVLNIVVWALIVHLLTPEAAAQAGAFGVTFAALAGAWAGSAMYNRRYPPESKER